MSRKAAGAALLIVVAIGTATAQLNRDRSRTPRSNAQSPSQALPQEYAVLLTRSIFAKSGLSAGPGFVGRGAGGGPDDADAAATASRSRDSSPESRWAFRGVFREGPHLIAFLEDLSSRKTYRLKVGDPVARGRIAEITLDQIWYQVGDKRSVVEIGQTLAGGVAAALPTSRPADSTTSGGPASTPPSAASSAEERMRQRRQQEGGR